MKPLRSDSFSPTGSASEKFREGLHEPAVGVAGGDAAFGLADFVGGIFEIAV